MSDGPYLFDIGEVALAHAGTPVSETPLSYVTDAIEGTIDAVVPYPALFGAHVVLSNYYGFSNADTSRLVGNFADASRVHWYDKMAESTVRAGFGLAADHNIDGWDGDYARVALEEGVETILTLDADFEAVDNVTANVMPSPEECATLNEYIGA